MPPCGAAPSAAASPLETLVVTATRRPDPVRDVPASVSTVSRDSFQEAGVRFIGQELQGLPGVLVSTNDAGTYTGITLRGVPNRIHNDTLAVLLDGVPMATGDDENDLEQLPFAAVGQVDVVRGPMSALYGRGAIAGTVEYRTREVGDAMAAQATLSGGSDAYRRGEASLQTPTVEGGALLLVGQLARGDGWRDRTGLREDNLFAKHRLDTAAGRLTLTATWVDTRQRLAGELPVDATGALIALPRGAKGNWNEDDAGFYKRMLTGTATFEAEPAEHLKTTTRLHARRALTSALQGFFNPFDAAAGTVTFTGFRVDGHTDALFAEQQADWQIGDARLLAGVSHERLNAHHVETWTGEFDFGPLFYAQQRDIRTGRHLNQDQWEQSRLLDAHGRARNWAAYAQGDYQIGRLLLSAGLRWDRFSRSVFYGPAGSLFGPDPVETRADTDQHVSPKGSATFKLTDSVNLYAAYGAGFSPGFGPLWSFRSRDTGLKPELADNIEAGIKGDFLDRRLAATLTAYQLKRRDLLQLLPVGGSARTINAGRQRSRGVEAEAVLDLSGQIDGLSLQASYGFTDARWTYDAFLEPGTERPFDFTGKRVPGVPRHAGRLGLSQRLAHWGVEAHGWVDLQGDYPYDSQNSVTAGGYALWNLAVTWRPLDAIELGLTVRNLFDRKVNSVVANNDGPFAAFPQPPRELLGSLKVEF